MRLFSKLPLTLFSRVCNQSVSCDKGSGTHACTAPVGAVISRRVTVSKVRQPAVADWARAARGRVDNRPAAGSACSSVRRFMRFSGKDTAARASDALGGDVPGGTPTATRGLC